MITTLLTILACTTHLTPIGISIFLIAVSIIVGRALISITKGLFAPSVLIITFSSGIIIIFFYCSMFCIHEGRYSKPKILLVVAILGYNMVIRIRERNLETEYSTNIIISFQEYFLSIGISVVILSILRINNRIIHPKKGLIRSY